MQDLVNVSEFLKRAAEKTGYVRERYVDKNIPTSFGNIQIMMFYGDMRSECILSSLLLNRMKELYPSKYFILCSYPGRAALYPYVDEYWGLQDEATSRSFTDTAIGFDNIDKQKMLFQEQQLNRYFENSVQVSEFFKYYNNGFTKSFIDEFKWIVYTLPSIPSSKVEFNRVLAQRSGYKVMIYPARTMRAWNKGREEVVKSRIDFWHELVERLLTRGFTPVVYQDYSTFDLSPKFESKCIYCTESKIIDVMGAMRTTGCALDVFGGFGRLSTLARTPFLSCAERHRYNNLKEWEIDELCNNRELPYRYIFSFPTIIESGYWNELVTNIVNRLELFLPQLNRDGWPSTAEQSKIAPYSLVKKRKSKKIGARFIKVPKV